MVDFSFLLFEFSVWLNAILYSRGLSPYALSFFLLPSLVLFIIVISAIVLTMNYPVSVHLCVWTDRAGFPLEWILSFICTVCYKEIQKQDTSLWNFEPDSGLGKFATACRSPQRIVSSTKADVQYDKLAAVVYINIYYVDSLDCLLLFLSISVFYF